MERNFIEMRITFLFAFALTAVFVDVVLASDRGENCEV